MMTIAPAIAAFDSGKFNKTVAPLKITRITPSGTDVGSERQIVFKFNQPVVPVGKMERNANEIPIAIKPEINCEWRWLNTSTLACQLGSKTKLKQATQYQVAINPGIKTEKGGTIAKPINHSFTTIRPAVSYSGFSNWRSPVVPVIQITFNMPVSKTSVEKYLNFKTGLTKHKIKVTHLNKSSHDKYAKYWNIEPRIPLKQDSQIRLMVNPGLQSQQGPLTGVEKRLIVNFRTFPEFRFKGISCINNKLKTIKLTQKNASRIGACSPQHNITLNFTAPIDTRQVAKAIQFKQENITWNKVLENIKAGASPHLGYGGSINQPHQKGRHYQLSISGAIQANKKLQIIADANKIKDLFNRRLGKDINIKFRTDHYKPGYSIAQNIVILEKNFNPVFPLSMVNINKFNFSYLFITESDAKSGLSKSIKTGAKVNQYKIFDFPVNDLLDGNSGLLVGHFKGTPRSSADKHPTTVFAQITPYHVHVKIGHFNSLVWVTQMDNGKPVANAKVSFIIGSLSRLLKNAKTEATAVTDKKGVAKLPGRIDLKSGTFNRYNNIKSKLRFVKVEKNKSVAFLPAQNNFEIGYHQTSKGSVSARIRTKQQRLKAWGLTAQGVYKLGETIQYKIFVRDYNNTGLTAAPSELEYTLKVTDPQNKTAHSVKKVKLNAFGSIAGEFEVPKDAVSGWYQFSLNSKKTNLNLPLRVLVTDFKPASFRAKNKLNAKLYQPGDQLVTATEARLHAGGPYGTAQVRLTTRLNPTGLAPDSPATRGYYFQTGRYGSRTLESQDRQLDNQGNYKHNFKIPDSPILYGRLSVESAIRDTRGKYIAVQSTATFAGRNRYIGLKHKDWTIKVGKKSTLNTIVIDEQGQPVAGTNIAIEIQRYKSFTKKEKGANDTWITKRYFKWEKESECKILSTSTAGKCHFTPKYPGQYKYIAIIKDTKGRSHSTQMQRWATGEGPMQWKRKPGFALDITAEKTTVKIGDTVKLMIKNPSPGASALLTIERYGILDSKIIHLKNSIEIIEIPVKKDYLPGFYVSVVLASPRTVSQSDSKPIPPAFKVGYAKFLVKDPYKELDIKIKTRKKVYQPRDTINVDLTVSTRHGKLPAAEIAVAVLDEAVFDLITGGKAYYDPYSGFYKLDSIDMVNYNLLLKLISRKKLEKKLKNRLKDGDSKYDYEQKMFKRSVRKPAPSASDRQYRSRSKITVYGHSAIELEKNRKPTDSEITVRSLFKYLSYWNANIRTDKQGKANISFTAPDNLTGWRILAIAVDKNERMGLGQGKFSVNQDIEIRPALPNQVVQNDRFEARFVVTNRTKTSKKITIQIAAKGNIKSKTASKTFVVTAKPFKRVTVGLPLVAGRDGKIIFTATAHSGKSRDATQAKLKIHQLKSMEVSATYGTSIQDKISENIKVPDNIRTDVGKISLIASTSVISNLKGAFQYLQKYPYICWEQKLTKGVMASHYSQLKNYLPGDLKWSDAKALPKQTLKMAARHQAPNGGMAYYIPSNKRVSPYLSAYTAIAFNWLRNHGHKIPVAVERKLHRYLLQMVRGKALPSFYSPGMSSTVRAVALAALAENGKLTLADIKRYHKHVKRMSLFGKAHYLQALVRIPGTRRMQVQVKTIIQNAAQETSGKYIFSEKINSSLYKRVLYSSLRSQCSILSSFLSHENQENIDATDVPFKLVRTISQTRKRSGRWENTQENMFCMNALIEYSKLYEKTKPDMTLSAFVDDQKMGGQSLKGFREKPVEFSRPIRQGDSGKKMKLSLQRKGKGRYYYAARLHYSLKNIKPSAVNAGIEIRREYSVERNGKWTLLKSPMKIKQGELVRIDLYLSLPAAGNFIVVDDPVPGGLEPVNTDLATASKVDANKAKATYAAGSLWFSHKGWRAYGFSYWSFYHKELLHHAARYYSEYLPKGNYHLSYVAQAIAPGEFTVMPTHVEEMYDPDIYGKSKPLILQVAPNDLVDKFEDK